MDPSFFLVSSGVNSVWIWRSRRQSSTLSHPVDAVAPLKSSLVILAYAWLSGVRLVTMSVGHFSLSESHSIPCHHSLLSSTCPPRLPRSAGISLVGTWRQVIPECSCVFIALLWALCTRGHRLSNGEPLSYPAIHSAVNRKPFKRLLYVYDKVRCHMCRHQL